MDAISSLSGDIKVFHILAGGEFSVRLWLDDPHVAEIILIASEEEQRHLLAHKCLLDDIQPFLHIVKALLIRDIISEDDLNERTPYCLCFEDIRGDHLGEYALPSDIPHL